MGNSLLTNFQPKNRFDCLDGKGRVNLMSYYLYMKKRRKKRHMEDDMDVDECNCMCEEELTASLLEEENATKKKHKRGKNNRLKYRNEEGEVVPLTYQHSSRYSQYVDEEAILGTWRILHF